MATTEEIVERYIAMWNEPDTQERRSPVAGTVTEDATYLDPGMSGDGPDGIHADEAPRRDANDRVRLSA